MDETSFLSEIAKEASREEEAILKKADEAAQKILEEARKEADRLEQTAVHRTDLEIRKTQMRTLTQESLERRRSLLQLKSRYVAKALEGAKGEFDAFKESREYPTILKKFLSELVKSVEGNVKKVIVRVAPQDEKVARPFVEDLSLKAELRPDPSLERGVELEEGEGGHLRMRNTFDSRLQKAQEEVIQNLNTVLFQGIDV